MEVRGIEPLAPCLQSRCSPAELHPHGAGEEQDPRLSSDEWVPLRIHHISKSETRKVPLAPGLSVSRLRLCFPRASD